RQRDEARRRTAEPDPGQQPEQQQHGNRICQSGENRKDAEQNGGNDKKRLAAQEIGKRTERGGTKRRTQKRRREDKSKIGDLYAEPLGDERRRDANRLRVDAV